MVFHLVGSSRVVLDGNWEHMVWKSISRSRLFITISTSRRKHPYFGVEKARLMAVIGRCNWYQVGVTREVKSKTNLCIA